MNLAMDFSIVLIVPSQKRAVLKVERGSFGNYLSELEAQPGGPQGGQLKKRARSP